MCGTTWKGNGIEAAWSFRSAAWFMHSIVHLHKRRLRSYSAGDAYEEFYMCGSDEVDNEVRRDVGGMGYVIVSV